MQPYLQRQLLQLDKNSEDGGLCFVVLTFLDLFSPAASTKDAPPSSCLCQPTDMTDHLRKRWEAAKGWRNHSSYQEMSCCPGVDPEFVKLGRLKPWHQSPHGS